MSIFLSSEGAAGEVTGSKHILETGGARVLVDCGAFQGKRGQSDAKNRRCVSAPEAFTAAVLTHAHNDHCGLVPLLSKRGYRGNIYATPATRDLASLIMMDSASIQARDAEYLAKQAAKRGEKFDWAPLYDEKDVIEATGQFVTVSYHRPMPIADGVRMELFDAGHILGSSMALLTVDSSGGGRTRVGFTGDLGRKGKPIVRDPDLLPPCEYLVLEATYGDRLHESKDDALAVLAETVRATAKRGGKVIIPAFAVERTQELVFYLHILVDQGKIPEIPIWVDSPMATNATGIFQVHPECYDEEIQAAFIVHHKNPFGFNSLHYSSSVAESKELNELKGPAIIISADGMCEAGRIQHHLVHCVQDPRNTILIVGYMAEDTLGRRIKDRARTVKIFGDSYDLRAQVSEINAFSAHADYSETIEWLSAMDLSCLKGLFLVHGEPAALSSLKARLEARFPATVRIVEYGERYELA
jgi:metallo-beta-lactamase family protein